MVKQENAKLFKRMQRADISAKYASEQMHVFKEEVVKNESQVAKLTDVCSQNQSQKQMLVVDVILGYVARDLNRATACNIVIQWVDVVTPRF